MHGHGRCRYNNGKGQVAGPERARPISESVVCSVPRADDTIAAIHARREAETSAQLARERRDVHVPIRASVATQRVAEPIGPHDLVISAGDCEFYGSCSCGIALGTPIKPDQSLNIFGERWERHVMTEHKDCNCEPCSW